MALTRRATAKRIHVAFSTGSTDVVDPTWVKLDAWTPKHIVRRMLPKGLTHFLDLSTNIDSSNISLSIADALPFPYKRIDASDLFRHKSCPPVSDEVNLLSLLEDVFSCARMHNLNRETHDLVIPLGQIGDLSVPRSPTTVVDWTWDDTLAVQVVSLDAERLFSRDKSYLLVGLTGQIGQSICEWMARNGAGCICLTSRRPNVDVKWLESFKGSGTRVKVFAMYVEFSTRLVMKALTDSVIGILLKDRI
jgi:hybrid polyketide synthase/nonribosomal peptide synthetase ACE1